MNEMITTRDFYFTSLLMSNGFKLLDSEKKIDGVYFKLFNHNNDLFTKLNDDFNNRNAYVNMSKFVKVTARLRKELDKYR